MTPFLGPDRSLLAGTSGWLVLLLPLTLLSVLLCSVFIRTADHQRQTLLLLADTTAGTNRYSALEWQAIGSTTLKPAFWVEVQASRATLTGLLQALQRAQAAETAGLGGWIQGRRAQPTAPSLGTVIGLLGEYLRATDGEFFLLRIGDRTGGRGLDETRVDPLATRLNEVTAHLRRTRALEAGRTVMLAVGLSVMTLLCSLVTVGVLAERLRQNRRAAQVHERERQEERERENRDPLTGLWNRQELHRLFARWTARGALSVLVLDLNRLQAINDSGGHAAGDTHLRRVALALLEVSQPHGLAARWGGDEFVLLLPGVSVQGAHHLAERASTLLETSGDPLPPFAYGAAHVPEATSLERVLALADAAMYEHKERQRVDVARLGQGARVGVTVEEFTSRLEQLETPQEVLGEGLELARTVLDFQASVSLERVGDGFMLRQLDGEIPGDARAALEGRLYHAGDGVTGQAIALSATRWSNDYPAEEYALDVWVAGGLKSVVMVPVRYGGRMMGLVGLLNFSSWRVVTPQARRLLEALASRLGHTYERVQAVESVRTALQGGLLALGVALEERDLETAGHTARVVELAGQLGARLGMSASKLDALRQGASLHDIGKLVIPDAILLKPGPLSQSEWNVMRNHAERGYEIAYRLSGLLPTTLDVIRSHHERWDGTGYPDALRGDAIPLPARIFAVCDVYDALTHVRPYKAAWSHGAAVAEIRAHSGTHFDPQVVEAFVTLIGPDPDVREAAVDTPRFPHP
ncbi:diguanylate cyclase [Deinococcus sp. KSM4-11]|uniref:HD domain-containing phosphohydrolase n=1 Tax=Deinococcus sp. KSM4-11 TaxID=2568654 RepID=UPI0010A2C7E9|nr:HD domain-containing phosphohydrolase [Deinococcus sp. KSM4-11]THF86655.1 diguanylate cyclase [Deinococcus sp. KSM4-11]